MWGWFACTRLGANALEEKANLDTQRLDDGVEAPTGDAVHAPLILVRLLVGDTDQVNQLLLGQAEHDAPLTHALADMSIDILHPWLSRQPCASLCSRCHC